MDQLAPCFAVDVYSYTVLGTHFHLVLRHEPLACRRWDDEAEASRWFNAFPPTEHGVVVEARKPEIRELMLGDLTGPRVLPEYPWLLTILIQPYLNRRLVPFQLVDDRVL